MEEFKQRLHKAILHVSGEVNETTLEMINLMAEKASSLTHEQLKLLASTGAEAVMATKVLVEEISKMTDDELKAISKKPTLHKCSNCKKLTDDKWPLCDTCNDVLWQP